MSNELQRYYMDSGVEPCDQCLMSRSSDGEWVKWEDVTDYVREEHNSAWLNYNCLLSNIKRMGDGWEEEEDS